MNLPNEELQSTIDGLTNGDQNAIQAAIAMLQEIKDSQGKECPEEILAYHDGSYILLDIEPVSADPAIVLAQQGKEIVEDIKHECGLTQIEYARLLEKGDVSVCVTGNFASRYLDGDGLAELLRQSFTTEAEEKTTSEIQHEDPLGSDVVRTT